MPKHVKSIKRIKRHKSHKSHKRKKKITKKLPRYKKKGGSMMKTLPRSDFCRYREPSGPGQKQSRSQEDCTGKRSEGFPCEWGNKLSWKSPKSSNARCYKSQGAKVESTLSWLGLTSPS